MSIEDRRLAALHAGVAGPGTLAGLHAALKARLDVVASEFPRLETKSGERAPSLIDGWLPPKDPDADVFPFIMIRPRAGEDSPQGAEQSSHTDVQIIVGTYSDTDDGWLDVLVLIDAVRMDLGGQPTIAGTGYEQVGPLLWDIPEQQSRPQWIGVITTKWNLPRPRRVEARNPQES